MYSEKINYKYDPTFLKSKRVKMIRKLHFILLGLLAPIATVFAVSHATSTHALGQVVSADNDGLAQPKRAPVNYWLIKSLSMRTLACLCANQFPVGLGAGKNSHFTFRVVRNGNNEESAIHSLCLRRSKQYGRRVLAHITLPLVQEGELKIATPGDDRYNPNAAVLRETMKGALVIPFQRQGYRLNRCPTNRDHYQGLNWAQPERWPGM